MNNFYVYVWIRKDKNHPFYVGKGSGGRLHVIKRNKYFANILQKVNSLGYECKSFILYKNLTEKEAFQKEIELISKFKEKGYKLTNLTLGGEGVSGSTWSIPIDRRNFKEKNGIYKKFGINHPSYNQKRTQETKRKMSESAKGRVLSDECRKSISKSLKGRKLSNETKEKMSKSRSNGNVWNSKKIIVYKDEEFYKEYSTIKSCALELNTSSNSIISLINGHKPKYGKLFGYSAIEKLEE